MAQLQILLSGPGPHPIHPLPCLPPAALHTMRTARLIGQIRRGRDMDGLRFERRAEGDYYKVLLHIGSTYVPISDEDIEELKKQSAILGDKLLEFFLDRVGYSSYLKDQIRAQLGKLGDPPKQITTLRQSIQDI